MKQCLSHCQTSSVLGLVLILNICIVSLEHALCFTGYILVVTTVQYKPVVLKVGVGTCGGSQPWVGVAKLDHPWNLAWSKFH